MKRLGLEKRQGFMRKTSSSRDYPLNTHGLLVQAGLHDAVFTPAPVSVLLYSLLHQYQCCCIHSCTSISAAVFTPAPVSVLLYSLLHQYQCCCIHSCTSISAAVFTPAPVSVMLYSLLHQYQCTVMLYSLLHQYQ
ncbi:UNVERIFIED_CONTAM: hypothetical protein FKN15_025881 [Acipenser sinensis]